MREEELRNGVVAMGIRFAAIGLNHYHVYGQADALLAAGAELVWFWGDKAELRQEFGRKYPQAKVARSAAEILEDENVQLVVGAAIPDQRAGLGIQVMQHGKHYLCAKPGFTDLAQLAEARRVQAESGRKYLVYFGERFGNPATVKAGELVQAGAIGRVVQTVGFGPHRLLGHVPRPDWTFQKRRHGGILNDLASHQIDQFLYFTGSETAEVAAAYVANVAHPQYPELEDFGELMLRSQKRGLTAESAEGAEKIRGRGEEATGYIRVDWLTPAGMPTWGDVRLFLTGTEGMIEIRKNVDLMGRPGGNHLFLVDKEGVHYVDCQGEPLPFGRQLTKDIEEGTETAVSQAHCFVVSELALRGQLQAGRQKPEGDV
jgi:predicted dehydrogenase